MPVTYDVDRDLSLIRTRCVGAVRLSDVVAHFRELRNDASLHERVDVLLDLTEVQTNPRSDQLRSAAREVESLGRKIGWGACAIVADRDILFGIARMFHAFAQDQFTHANVLRDREEAERWLASLRTSGDGA
jgi:hypothetical protein